MFASRKAGARLAMAGVLPLEVPAFPFLIVPRDVGLLQGEQFLYGLGLLAGAFPLQKHLLGRLAEQGPQGLALLVGNLQEVDVLLFGKKDLGFLGVFRHRRSLPASESIGSRVSRQAYSTHGTMLARQFRIRDFGSANQGRR